MSDRREQPERREELYPCAECGSTHDPAKYEEGKYLDTNGFLQPDRRESERRG